MNDIKVASQTLDISDVTSITVTERDLDDLTGKYYRSIVVFGTAPIENGAIPTLLTVRVWADESASIHIDVPQAEM